MATAVMYRDTNPPYLFPAYDSAVDRAPREPLIEVPPGWLRQAPGPDFRRIPVPADGADLDGRHGIRGVVRDGRGERVSYPDAMLELWVGDQFARTRTSPDGEYRAVLRKPAAAALPGGQPLAPWVNVTVFARGLLKQVQTRMYFPDEGRANAADPVLDLVPRRRRPALAARREDGGLRFDIRLQGPGETPFFAF